jgi:hypothetical protein
MSCAQNGCDTITLAAGAAQVATAVGSASFACHCPRCGGFTTKDGQCHNPMCHAVRAGREVYDPGRMIGRQYRKREDEAGNLFDGQTYEVGGRAYTVNASSADPADFSIARMDGLAPSPQRGQVRAGRFFERAADVLRNGNVAKAPDGTVEVYDHDGNLVSAYEPNRRATADRSSNARGSTEQFAALMAYAAYYDRSEHGGLGSAFRQDLIDFMRGQGSALRAADGFYLLLKEGGFMDIGIRMGGTLKTLKCPTCGAQIGKAGCRKRECHNVTVAQSEPISFRSAQNSNFDKHIH